MLRIVMEALGRTWPVWSRSRLTVLAVVMVPALAWSFAQPAGGSWERLLGEEGVEAQTIAWVTPPQPGQWAAGLVEGRSAESGARLDVFAFEGMLSGEGLPYRVRRVGNLSQTPDADEVILAVADVTDHHLAAVAHRVEGLHTGLTLLDLSGDPTGPRDEEGVRRPLGDRLRIGVTHLQDDGRWDGVGRHHYDLDPPSDALTIRVEGTTATLAAAYPDGKRWAELDLETGAWRAAPHLPALTLQHTVAPWILGTWSTWLANRARAVPAIGPRKVAVGERVVLDVMEALRHLYYGTVGDETAALSEELGAEPEVPLPEFHAPEGGIDVGGEAEWPPPNVPPLQGPGVTAVPQEGVWKRWIPPWVDVEELDRAPWPIYRTAVRVNPQRAYDSIVLIAMDMRQLELHLQAGTHNPQSTTGYRGTGEIPRDPELLGRLMMAFNGGFKTSHGAYGMMLDRKLFIPPKPATASLTFHDDGTLRMGTWPGQAPMGNYNQEKDFAFKAAREGDAPPAPPDVVSFRQNLPPLLERGEVNPQGAVRWGGTVEHLSAANTPRSGICIRPEHTLVFAWGSAASANELGEAMRRAGCVYGMHLDMNPFHTGIAMYHVPVQHGALPPEDGKTGFVGALNDVPAPKMWFDWFRYLRTDLKDFFYVTRKPTMVDRAGPSLPPGFSPWSSHGLPVRYGGVLPAALLSTSAHVRVLALDPDAFEASLTPPGRIDAAPPVPGELQIGLERESNTLWQAGGAAGRPALTLTPDARLALTDDSSTLPADQAAIPGTWLLRNHVWVDRAPLASAPDALVALETVHGVVELVHCVGCGSGELEALLNLLPVERALLLGPASLYVVSGAQDGAWLATLDHASDDLNPRLRLLPRAVPAPIELLEPWDAREPAGP